MSGKYGVEVSVKVLDLLAELVCDGVDLVKSPALGKMRKVLEVVEGLTAVASSVTDVLPEVTELDAEDIGQLSAAGYAAVKKVVDKIKA